MSTIKKFLVRMISVAIWLPLSLVIFAIGLSAPEPEMGVWVNQVHFDAIGINRSETVVQDYCISKLSTDQTDQVEELMGEAEECPNTVLGWSWWILLGFVALPVVLGTLYYLAYVIFDGAAWQVNRPLGIFLGAVTFVVGGFLMRPLWNLLMQANVWQRGVFFGAVIFILFGLGCWLTMLKEKID